MGKKSLVDKSKYIALDWFKTFFPMCSWCVALIAVFSCFLILPFSQEEPSATAWLFLLVFNPLIIISMQIWGTQAFMREYGHTNTLAYIYFTSSLWVPYLFIEVFLV